MSEDTLLPDLPRPPRRYEVTVIVPRAGDGEDALVPPGGHAALQLAAAAVCADGVVSAWTSSNAVVSMVVDKPSLASALAAGVAVARALGGEDGPVTVTAEPAGAAR